MDQAKEETRAFPQSYEDAVAFDTADELAPIRAHFSLPKDITYLVGHSLGVPTRKSLTDLRQAAEDEWANGLVGSWNSADWINLPRRVGAQIAPLLGVAAHSVIVCDSVSLNIYKLVGALLSCEGMAQRVIVNASEFPTDQYILERLSAVSGADFVRVESGVDALSGGGIFVHSLVDYRTGEVANVVAMEALASQCGAVIVWDLSHATGVVDLKLADWGAKYAVGCTYKYLNGGPGAPAFLYVDPAEVGGLETPLAGWLGHARPFAFEPSYEAAEGMQRFVAGTPPILSMSALNGALSVFEDVSMEAVHRKACALGDMCLHVFDRLGLESVSPPIGSPRGGHVSLIHADGYALSRALSECGHKTDFRPPTTIRFGLSPLYLSYADVWHTLEALEEILTSEAYRDPKYAVRTQVT